MAPFVIMKWDRFRRSGRSRAEGQAFSPPAFERLLDDVTPLYTLPLHAKSKKVVFKFELRDCKSPGLLTGR